MSRDVSKLKVFAIADRLVVDVYQWTRGFPVDERFGLTSQIRRAAVSVPTNLVEGSMRSSEREYLRFIEIAYGSSEEVAYLIRLAVRLDYGPSTKLASEYTGLSKALNSLQNSFKPRASVDLSG